MPTRRFALHTLGALAALACTACAAPVQAQSGYGSLVDMQIVDRARGTTLQTWRARGASWIAGRPGDRYAVRLTNRTGGRVLVVLSVDGVNVVSGETAATGQTGYVLAPWQTTEITGWRKSWQEAAAFYFTSLPDSYAARTDRPDHVGVIGAAVFRERVAYVPPPVRPFEAPIGRSRGDGESERRAEAPSADAASGYGGRMAQGAAASPPSAAAEPSRRDRAAQASDDARERSLAKAESKLGTGHGEREYSPTTQTAFERATSNPAEIVQVRYDSYANLLAAGIVPQPRPRPQPQPDPFPAFVPDPRG